MNQILALNNPQEVDMPQNNAVVLNLVSTVTF